MAKTKDKKWTEADVAKAIRQKYAAPKWATFFNVPNSTGFSSTRRADGIAMGLWPSEGLHLHGFEIKVSRSDWLREIQDPLKAHAIGKFCHFWWVIAPAGVVKVEEMPDGWGLQQVSGNGLRVKKGTEPKEPETMTMGFLAAILRKAHETSANEKECKAAHDQGYEAGKRRAESNSDFEKRRIQRRLESLEESVRKFQEVSGIRIDDYNGAAIGEAVRALQNSGVRALPQALRNQVKRFEEIAKNCRHAADVLGECFES